MTIDERLSELLGFSAYGTFIQNVHTSNFGKQVVLECVADTRSEPKPYKIVFSDCKKITWQVFIESFDPPEVGIGFGADLIGLRLGDDHYASPFVAHTDLFEVVIEYDRLNVILQEGVLFNDDYYPLSEEHVDDETENLIRCAYPYGIPDSHYHTLLSILIKGRSIRSLASVIARIRGGHYTIYMGEVGDATRYEPDPEVEANIMEKLVSCGYKHE